EPGGHGGLPRHEEHVTVGSLVLGRLAGKEPHAKILPELAQCSPPGAAPGGHILQPMTTSPARPGRTLRLPGRGGPPGSFGVMAVINRTPDSFFDQGATYKLGAALEAADRAVAEGADILDVGGVKAGPGDEVTVAEEIRRIRPLVAALRARYPDVVISVDTWRAGVAR